MRNLRCFRVVVTIEKVIKSAMELSKKGAVWLEQRKRKINLEGVEQGPRRKIA